MSSKQGKPSKSLKEQLAEAVTKESWGSVASLAVRCSTEAGKDKDLVTLTTISKSATKVTAEKVESVEQVQKSAISFGTSNQTPKASTVFALTKSTTGQ